jgi:hypothetical protein
MTGVLKARRKDKCYKIALKNSYYRPKKALQR